MAMLSSQKRRPPARAPQGKPAPKANAKGFAKVPSATQEKQQSKHPNSNETSNEFESTRLIVKNLPRYVTSDRLREHFSTQGRITDARVLCTAEGRSRGFAFVGYQSVSEAAKALKYFDNTYIDTTRLQIEFARPRGDPGIPRAWSRYTLGSSAFSKEHPELAEEAAKSSKQCNITESSQKTDNDEPKTLIDELFELEQKRPILKAYADVLQHRAHQKSWENDTDHIVNAELKNITTDTQSRKRPALLNSTESKRRRVDSESSNDDAESDDEYQVLPSTAEGKLIKEDTNDDDKLSENQTATSDDNTDDGHKERKRDGEIQSNRKMESTDTNAENSEDHDSHHYSEENDFALVERTKRVYLVNLPFSASEGEIAALFAEYGPLHAFHVPVSPGTQKPRGVAFATYRRPEDARKALTGLNDRVFQGRVLRAKAARAEPQKAVFNAQYDADGNLETSNGEPLAEATSSFKEKKAREIREKATSAHNWNALFVSPRAAADAVASQMRVDKADLFDVSSSDAAVRYAIAETHVIAQTKAYFESYGVDLEAFNAGRGGNGKLRTFADATLASADLSTTADARSESRALLIKNLPANTKPSAIASLCAAHTSAAALGRVLVPPSGTTALVEFLSNADATRVFSALAYSRFGGLPLYLEWAPTNVFMTRYDPVSHSVQDTFAAAGKHKTVEQDGEDAEESAETIREQMDIFNNDADDDNRKLLVRNVPFEASLRDVKQLFGSYAEVKSVRLPRKLTGGHRGFAFLEFFTAAGAREALKALRNTHLYGRRLVLEFARTGDQATN